MLFLNGLQRYEANLSSPNLSPNFYLFFSSFQPPYSLRTNCFSDLFSHSLFLLFYRGCEGSRVCISHQTFYYLFATFFSLCLISKGERTVHFLKRGAKVERLSFTTKTFLIFPLSFFSSTFFNHAKNSITFKRLSLFFSLSLSVFLKRGAKISVFCFLPNLFKTIFIPSSETQYCSRFQRKYFLSLIPVFQNIHRDIPPLLTVTHDRERKNQHLYNPSLL
ncbi:hypothetical protein EV199_4688 [Pseudobacter ginsenosidimutans]|uniref:Uncharacterized protein n=1 Tax=Pseudobacter ginsenosidimutans TaxID=661488 RepID=A0A4Q7MZU7_9BACT|nr:hypothetical protein EV199_4688 [Pseudobacter ginsenosidimutans]